MSIRNIINHNLKIGRVVKYFILVDLALLAGWGLIEPVFGVFVVREVQGATLVTIGTMAAIYWLLKSVLQLPLANYLDRTKGEKDDFYALILGLFIAAASAFSFAAVTTVWQLYLVQILHSIGFAFYVASWPAIFSRHLDKNRVSFDWALDSTAVGVSAGITGYLGSVVADRFGFDVVFILGGIFTVISALVLLAVPDLVIPERTKEQPRKDHTPAAIGK